jgi:7,8-dihydropterin-6-yl-methyl-4-(beta-D-ribofuranosyl)aminobenzene 5'-phosphate synthase
MISELKITVLTDNYVAAPNLLAEHGLSMLIEADGRRVLFDTGQSREALHNAEALGVSLARLDAVVLSHGHYDHTGGLADVLPEYPPAAICLHPAALEPKYARSGHPPHRPIGIPAGSRQAVEALHERITWTDSATEIVPGVWCTGEIPRAAGNAQATSDFFRDAECSMPDPVTDDQALFLETPEGLVVIAGCAHSGIVNTLDCICALRGCDEVFALIGGLHLGRASSSELEAAVHAIERRNCRILGPCHCTGLNAQAYLRACFRTLVQDVGAGAQFIVGNSERPRWLAN